MKMMLTIILIAVAALVIVFAYSAGKEGETKRATVAIRNAKFDVEVKDTAFGRARGLSGRPSLPEDEGMLFLFGHPSDYGFWMKDMLFPIDIIWIRENVIVDITRNAAPEPDKNVLTLTVHRPSAPADTVLEVAAGTADRYGFAVGDAVHW